MSERLELRVHFAMDVTYHDGLPKDCDPDKLTRAIKRVMNEESDHRRWLAFDVFQELIERTLRVCIYRVISAVTWKRYGNRIILRNGGNVGSIIARKRTEATSFWHTSLVCTGVERCTEDTPALWTFEEEDRWLSTKEDAR